MLDEMQLTSVTELVSPRPFPTTIAITPQASRSLSFSLSLSLYIFRITPRFSPMDSKTRVGSLTKPLMLPSKIVVNLESSQGREEREK